MMLLDILLPSHQGGPTTVPCFSACVDTKDAEMESSLAMGISFSSWAAWAFPHRPFWTNCVRLEHFTVRLLSFGSVDKGEVTLKKMSKAR
jgi:hypothetical protein